MTLDLIAEWVKSYLLPGSIWFLILGLTAGVVGLYLGRRRRRWFRLWLALLAATYWLMASPWFSDALVGVVSGDHTRLSEPLADVDAVLILGGGAATYQYEGKKLRTLSDASALRALEGWRLYEVLEPDWVIVSGGNGADDEPESLAMREALVSLGVPEEVILLESHSSDTYEQALELKPLMEAHKIGLFVLVTSPLHMRRSLAVFHAQGFDPIVSVSAPVPGASTSDARLSRLFPSEAALRRSLLAGREALALFYYWGRGRIASPLG